MWHDANSPRTRRPKTYAGNSLERIIGEEAIALALMADRMQRVFAQRGGHRRGVSIEAQFVPAFSRSGERGPVPRRGQPRAAQRAGTKPEIQIVLRLERHPHRRCLLHVFEMDDDVAGVGTLAPPSVQDGQRWKEVVAVLAGPEVLRSFGLVGAGRRV